MLAFESVEKGESMANSSRQVSSDYHLSTHILDTSRGCPAAHVRVQLWQKSVAGEWDCVETLATNSDGRIVFKAPVQAADFKIIFFVTEYFSGLGMKLGEAAFFINPEVSFCVMSTNRNYHVPLLVSPFGYSTYRGS